MPNRPSARAEVWNIDIPDQVQNPSTRRRLATAMMCGVRALKQGFIELIPGRRYTERAGRVGA